MLTIKKLTKNDKFRIGSLTKLFTSFAVIKLYEEGKVDIDDHILKYVDLPFSDLKDITIRSILMHESGIKKYARCKNTK